MGTVTEHVCCPRREYSVSLPSMMLCMIGLLALWSRVECEAPEIFGCARCSMPDVVCRGCLGDVPGLNQRAVNPCGMMREATREHSHGF